jgi:hypothetical protein
MIFFLGGIKRLNVFLSLPGYKDILNIKLLRIQ